MPSLADTLRCGMSHAGRTAPRSNVPPIRMFMRSAAGLAVVMGLALPASASAATCSDYPNQAAAQQAADTRDADHDGIFCEALPCPCAKPDDEASTPKSRPKQTMLQRVGGSRTLPPGRTKGSHCRTRRSLPDRRCTPGAVFRHATPALICRSDYVRRVRKLPSALKDKVFREYGIRHSARARYRIAHLVPLGLGGSNAVANLYPLATTPAPGRREKARLARALRHGVCGADEADLRTTQRAVARNWLTLFSGLEADGAIRSS